MTERDRLKDCLKRQNNDFLKAEQERDRLKAELEATEERAIEHVNDFNKARDEIDRLTQDNLDLIAKLEKADSDVTFLMRALDKANRDKERV